MFAIPPNNYDFYTEEEKYVRAARGRDARTSRRGSERDERRHKKTFLERETNTRFPSFRFFFLFRRSPPNARRPLPTTSYTCRSGCTDR